MVTPFLSAPKFFKGLLKFTFLKFIAHAYYQPIRYKYKLTVK